MVFCMQLYQTHLPTLGREYGTHNYVQSWDVSAFVSKWEEESNIALTANWGTLYQLLILKQSMNKAKTCLDLYFVNQHVYLV